jgi:hypothetical protein
VLATLARGEYIQEGRRRKKLQRLLKVKQEGGALYVRRRSVHLYIGKHDKPIVNVV